jgi:acetolactate synthase-1/2/3 large subunit
VGYVLPLVYPVFIPGTLLTPGYQGTLGFGFPTAIGASVARPERALVSLNGDGGFGVSMQELSTLRALNANVTVVVMTDGLFGNVDRAQRQRFGRSHGVELVNPDFVRLAESFDVSAQRVTTPEALCAALKEAIATPGPALLEVPIGEMPTPWHLLRDYLTPPAPAPPNPLATTEGNDVVVQARKNTGADRRGGRR